MIPPHTNRYPKPPSGAATGWGRFFCVLDGGERAAAGGAAKPLRPRRLGQPFGPGPLCRSATSPRAAGSHPCEGSLLRGRSPREEPPLTGEVAERQRWPEGFRGLKSSYPKMGSNARPFGTSQASRARPAPLMGSLFARAKPARGASPHRGGGRAAAMAGGAFEVCGSGRYTGGMNPSPTGGPLKGG